MTIPTPDAQIKTLKMIWFATMSAIGVYWLVVLIRGNAAAPIAPHPAVLAILSLYALGGFAFGWLWHHRRITTVERRLQAWTTRPGAEQEAVTLGVDLFNSTIIAIVCMESPAVVGLIIVLLGWPTHRPFYLFSALSVGGLIGLRQRAFPALADYFERLGRLAPAH